MKSKKPQLTATEMVMVRQALRKMLCPWIDGGISFDEWCTEVDCWFPDQTGQRSVKARSA